MSKKTDVSQWSRDHTDHKHPFWWGILILIIIEIMVVLAFVTSYFYLWIVNTADGKMGWPPQGTVLPPLTLPTINTILLLFCSWTMYYGGILIKRNQIRKFFWIVIVCCVASITILYLRFLQFQNLPFSWNDNAYASFVWSLTGFHFVHLSSAFLGTAVIGWFAYNNYYTDKRSLGAQVDTMYWYFVSAAWLPLYFVMYIAPRIF